MKKNNLLPILLVAGAGVAAFVYFKNKGKAKEMAEGVDVEPQSSKKQSDDQTTTSEDEGEPESKASKYIKAATSIYKGVKQTFKGRKKRKAQVYIGPTESSSTPFADVTKTTRKQRRMAKRTTRRTARTMRKQKRSVTGFGDIPLF